MSENAPKGTVPPEPDEPASPAAPTGGGFGPAGSGAGDGPPRAASVDIVVEGLKYGWRKFTGNPGPFLIAGALGWVALFAEAVVLWILLWPLVLIADPRSEMRWSLGDGVAFAALLLLAAALPAYVQTVSVNAALRAAAGRALSVGDLFRLPNAVRALATSVTVVVGSALGLLLLLLPGIAVAGFAIFATVVALDRGAGPIRAIGASVGVVRNNLPTALLLLATVLVLNALGAVTYVGILVTYPVSALVIVYVHRRLGELAGDVAG